MKKWILRAIGVLAVIFGAIIVFIIIGETDASTFMKFTKNENLPTVKEDWKGTPVDQKDRFINAEFPFLPSTIEVLKWQLSTNPQKKEKQNDNFQLKVQNPTEFLNSEKDGILWLGHASVLIRLSGKTILLDPVFDTPSLIERYFSLPSPIEKIKQIDYVLTTHDHRDHLDEATIKAIAQKFPNAKFLAGLGSENILKDWISDENRIQTAGWYQQFSLKDENIKITFIPVRHWSRRGLFDTNIRLWGGFIIQGATKTIYHGGDSGYGSHYKEMAEVFPEIDYFIIGIGSYAPRWFMKANHNNPEDALQAFIDSKAKILVPMHYATFNMSDEPPGEPLNRLQDKASETNLTYKVKSLDIYESLFFEN